MTAAITRPTIRIIEPPIKAGTKFIRAASDFKTAEETAVDKSFITNSHPLSTLLLTIPLKNICMKKASENRRKFCDPHRMKAFCSAKCEPISIDWQNHQ